MFEESNDSSMTVGLLVGVIVLVFTGIFFSLLVDKRFKFSSSQASLQESVTEEANQLEAVRERLDAATERWKKEGLPLSGQEADLKKASKAAKSTKIEVAALLERQAAAAAELSAGSWLANSCSRGKP